MMSASDLFGLSCSPFCRYHCLTSVVHEASTDMPSDVLWRDGTVCVGVLVELHTLTHDDVTFLQLKFRFYFCVLY